MDYDLSKIGGASTGEVSPYLTYGTNQLLRITQIELKVSQNTGSPRAILHMEGKPISSPGFTPVEGAKGKVGKVAASIYMKEIKVKTEFLQRMKVISMVLGLEEEFNQIKSDTFEGAVTQISKLLSGKDLYARYTLFAEEYPKKDGKIGITLFLPRYAFVDSADSDGSSLVEFNKANQYHFKRIPEQTGEVKADTGEVDDLPF